LRFSDSGKLTVGIGRIGKPIKLRTALSAWPVSSSSSMRMLAARRIQSGIQLGPGRRWQVV